MSVRQQIERQSAEIDRLTAEGKAKDERIAFLEKERDCLLDEVLPRRPPPAPPDPAAERAAKIEALVAKRLTTPRDLGFWRLQAWADDFAKRGDYDTARTLILDHDLAGEPLGPDAVPLPPGLARVDRCGGVHSRGHRQGVRAGRRRRGGATARGGAAHGLPRDA
jgi:hypothetical protein